ncbi:hypothetical protein Tco_0484596, partial [Tanacetum coccineum]
EEVKEVKNDESVEIKEEGNKMLRMRELLNELKNGDGNEGSGSVAETTTPRRLGKLPEFYFSCGIVSFIRGYA